MCIVGMLDVFYLFVFGVMHQDTCIQARKRAMNDNVRLKTTDDFCYPAINQHSGLNYIHDTRAIYKCII